MKIEVLSFGVPVMVEVIPSARFDEMEGDEVIIAYDDKSEIPSTYPICVRIIVDSFREIWYYMDDFISGIRDLKILLPENSNALFIGGKSKSMVVDLIECEPKEEHYRVLFWDFTITPNGKYILDEGELSCVLRDFNGKIIREVGVEPPYVSEYVDEGILYHCDGITGAVLLKFDE